MAGRTIIVGGGISGLSAAYDLNDCVILEKQARLGGVIETRSWENCLMDCGPDSFISAKPEALTLIKELGLDADLIGSNDHQRTTYILRKGRLVAMPEGMMMMVPSKVMPMLKSPLVGWGTKILMGLELLRRPGAAPDRSVAEFVVDHFGNETLDYLAEPLLSGVYGGDPREMSVASVLPRFLQMEAKYGSLGRAVLGSKSSSSGPLFRTLKGGLSKLVEALAKTVTVKHTAAETIARRDGRFRVRADGDWMEADRVILACPAWSAAELVSDLDGELARLLSEIPYSSSLTLTLIYEAAQFDGMRAGFGFLIPKVERQRLAACTFVGTKFAHRAPDDRIILRCFFGGVVQESDDAVVAIARQELQRILGLTAAPVFHAVNRWPRSMAQYTVGHIERMRDIRNRVSKIPGLHLAGNAYEGIGIPDCVRTGRAAARAILDGKIE